MDSKLIEIAQKISAQGFANSNSGLMNGNTGISIFFYHLSRKTGNQEYEKIADGLLDKVYANLSSSVLADFENGLAGIGYGIEYLVQNRFAEGNTDEILEEVDNKIFRYLMEDVSTSFELTTGLTGYLYYLIIRLNNLTNTDSFACRINRELLFLTINRIDELVTAQFSSIVKDLNFDLFWRFSAMLFGLSKAFKLNIYNEKIVCMIKQWIPYFETYIPSLHINRLLIAVSLNKIYKQIPDARLKKHIQILLYAIEFDILKSEVDFEVNNLRLGWPGVVLLLNIASKELDQSSPNYLSISKTYFEINEKREVKTENLQKNSSLGISYSSGLSYGITGIGFLELMSQQ